MAATAQTTDPFHFVHPPRCRRGVVSGRLRLCVIVLDVADHRHLVGVERLPVDDLLHGLLAHRTHVVRQGQALLCKQCLLTGSGADF